MANRGTIEMYIRLAVAVLFFICMYNIYIFIYLVVGCFNSARLNINIASISVESTVCMLCTYPFPSNAFVCLCTFVESLAHRMSSTIHTTANHKSLKLLPASIPCSNRLYGTHPTGYIENTRFDHIRLLD